MTYVPSEHSGRSVVLVFDKEKAGADASAFMLYYTAENERFFAIAMRL